MKFHVPERKRVVKWVLAVVGAILLSALGSGVWESWLSPIFRPVGRGILDLLSFVIKGYKDGIYQRIATDNQWAASNESLFVLTLLYLFLWICVTAFMVYTDRRMKRSTDDLQGRIEKDIEILSGKAEPEKKQTTAELIASLEDLKRRTLEAGGELRKARYATYLVAACAALLSIGRLEAFERLSYVNTATSHYHQVIRIASVYMQPQERLQVDSDFAQIQNRDGYVRVLSKLEKICTDHGQRVPEFKAW